MIPDKWNTSNPIIHTLIKAKPSIKRRFDILNKVIETLPYKDKLLRKQNCYTIAYLICKIHIFSCKSMKVKQYSGII